MSEKMSGQKSISKPYHHGQLREALLAAGQALLVEEGVSGLDLRKVARRAGVSHSAPYRHFADKQALLAAIAENGFHQLNGQIERELQHAGADLQERLTVLARAYTQFAREHSALMREMFSGLTINRAAYPDLYKASKVAFTFTIETIQHGQEQGKIAKGDSIQLTLVAWSLVHGLAMLLVEHQIPEAENNDEVVEQMVRMSIQTLYNGLSETHQENP